jgi:hypothetical protein
MLGRMFRRLGALSRDPRTASLRYHWMALTWMLLAATGLLGLALPPELDWLLYGLPGGRASLMVALFALSAALVAGRRLSRKR